jgi:nitric oxide reductase NorE protein
MTVFALFFGTIVYYRMQHPLIFHAGQRHLVQTFGAINTLFLLTSSLFVVFGVRAVRSGKQKWAPRMFGLAALCGTGFAVVKCIEYGEKIHQHLTPATNDFYMYFFVFTGIHFLHLLIGMGVLAFVWRLSRRERIGAKELSLIESGTCYWHMVDLLWVVLFPLFYLMQ